MSEALAEAGPGTLTGTLTESPAAALATDPIYVYAVMGGGTPDSLPSEGVDPQRPVMLLAAGNVQAAISPVRSDLFNEEAVHAGLEDQNWLAVHVLAH